MSRLRRMPRETRRRSYDQYCAAARALDTVGDRWTLLVVRELLAGPRRYSDLHADLPGVSTDVLASRLKEMEQSGLALRRRLARPSSVQVYELTPRGRALLPVLDALAAWGAPDLAGRRPTDAVRAHWFAVPLLGLLAPAAASAGRRGAVEVRIDEGVFHLLLGPGDPEQAVAVGHEGAPASAPAYGDGPAPAPAAVLTLTTDTCTALVTGALTLAEGVRSGRIAVEGDGGLVGAGDHRGACA
ncbi:winged helix-turn-helix transcriptional regulator [Streptomyces sp. C10-9-1]|uniref:winged helix-turn-helix transcriptional regulator n=1 Tax=Streptomyces sp. C10-9-1 TaxID=1859285 RepID=UPI002112B1BE|nr:winged helix-turn-helix transcriptional regulator [Streptomyces sp. C10-9-1]MCQ6556145.1 winged helix-turn-helix transcriptional regulator [Streptomyces sp. C10-9-1]